MPEEVQLNVAVIGAGIHGSSVALALSDRGHRVTIFDRFGFGHVHGSSHGRSRIIRKAYEDPFFTGIMVEAYGMWDELQVRSHTPIVHHTGILYFGSTDSSSLAEVRSSLEANGVGYRIWDENETARIRVESHELALFSPDGGWVHADASVSLLHDLAVRNGVEFVSETVDRIDRLRSNFDHIVVAAGPWMGEFVEIDISLRIQTIVYIEGDWHGPVWIEDGPDFLYGFPNAEGENAFKIGVHAKGEAWTVNRPRPGPDPESIELARDFARNRFGIADPRVAETATCVYTMTPDEDFRWGWIDDQSVFVSACSGHGFKFGLWIGAKIADALEGKFELSSIPRFNRPAVMRTFN